MRQQPWILWPSSKFSHRQDRVVKRAAQKGTNLLGTEIIPMQTADINSVTAKYAWAMTASCKHAILRFVWASWKIFGRQTLPVGLGVDFVVLQAWTSRSKSRRSTKCTHRRRNANPGQDGSSSPYAVFERVEVAEAGTVPHKDLPNA